MGGTVAGGRKTALKNKYFYGANYYARIGAMGGKKGRTGGFASKFRGVDGLTGQQRPSFWGSKGGRVGRRKWTAAERAHHSVAMRKARER